MGPSADRPTAPVIDPQWYRRVLGQYPTGVCVITADSPQTGPSGMVVGSFTSVSLEPTLVAFYPARTSTSWAKIESAGHFCVNILGADQEDICRIFASRAANKFENVAYHRAPQTGSPVIDGVVGWIDCDIYDVHEAGDHVAVLGQVRELGLESPRLPLLFFQGGYGRFSPLSLTAANTSGSLTTPLRQADLIRPVMEQIAEKLNCRCLVGARVEDDIVVLASAGQSRVRVDTGTLVGQRVPNLPPGGSVFAAWTSAEEQEGWLEQASEPVRERHRAALRLIRERGYSLGLLSPAQREFVSALEAKADDPSPNRHPALFGLMPKLSYDPADLTPATLALVRQVSAPVFEADGSVALALTIIGYGTPSDGPESLIAALLDAASAATRLIGGQERRPPAAPLITNNYARGTSQRVHHLTADIQ